MCRVLGIILSVSHSIRLMWQQRMQAVLPFTAYVLKAEPGVLRFRNP